MNTSTAGTGLRAGIHPEWVTHTVADTTTGSPGGAVLLPTEAIQLASSRDVATTFHELLEQRWLGQGRRAAERTVALDFGEYTFSVADLIERSDRLCNYLIGRGLRPGMTVGVLLERSLDLYAVQLAVSKAGATFVPLDAAFPAERIDFILEDSGASFLISTTDLVGQAPYNAPETVALDLVHAEVASAASKVRPTTADGTVAPAYLIYTSGTTGRPKGVVVTHDNICNFIDVASQSYGYQPGDRVFQGLSQAFDFAVEETWVPLAAGATLVPAPRGVTLVGAELHEFLTERAVTALCCVPTLLATLPADLPRLSFLLVSGEACPKDVIQPWLTGGRRVLNAYGPTESTVTATWCEVKADESISIGGPLSSYAVVIAEPGAARCLPKGRVGEICVGGPGVAAGYLNRPELTTGVFVDDFVGFDSERFPRWYRTGDLGRINDENRIEFLGRIDTQVKVNGYRIELGEIETVIRAIPEVAQVAVTPVNPEGRGVVLAAYIVSDPPRSVDFDVVDRRLKQSLPTYMVPVYYEHIEHLPTLANSKFDRDQLPPPTSARWTSSTLPHVEPTSETERTLVTLLKEVMSLGEVSVEADFFDDMGANSLTMAAYVTEIRKSIRVRRMSMKLIYQNSSIRALAARIDELLAAATPSPEAKATPVPEPHSPEPDAAASPRVPQALVAIPALPPATPGVPRLQHILFGFAQAAIMVGFTYLLALATVGSFRWVVAAEGLVATYTRSVVSGAGLLFGVGIALVAVKWLVIGRFDAASIPLWSMRHLRFWIVRLAIQANPMNLFRGTPIYNVFLRSLGMKVGPRSVILAGPPTCTDLVSIGADSVIRGSARLLGYKVRTGRIDPGPIRVGSGVVVADGTYLDIDSGIGDGGQLGTTSSLLEGQVVPPGETYQGSPAERSSANFCEVESMTVSGPRRVTYVASTLIWTLLVSAPMPFILSGWVAGLDFAGWEQSVDAGWLSQAAWLALVAAATYFGSLILALMAVVAVPRLMHLFVVTGQAHPLFGTQHMLANGIARVSNNKLLNTVFGDSSMILGYLRMVGYDLSSSTQTGSNFGVDQQHHSPFLCVFNRNTLVSDGLRLLNTEVSATSFITRQVVVPADTYLGNDVFYPANAAVGDNCLIATKAAIPVEGAIRSNVGILGSPPFEIPRSVKRDKQFDHFKQPGVIEGRLKLKLRSNLVTLGLYFVRSWLLAWVALGVTAIALAWTPSRSVAALAGALTAAGCVSLVAVTLLAILGERLVRGFRGLEPQFCSLYERAFWDHERFWKLNYNAFLQVFDGTPMKPVFLRLQGAKIGAQLFDDGGGLTEPSLVTIGDHCALNYGSAVQAHSLEDGTFKSDRIVIGDRCTVGAMALVHYGTTLHDDAVIEPDAFLMKGSEVETQSVWLGNPARNVSSASSPVSVNALTARSELN